MSLMKNKKKDQGCLVCNTCCYSSPVLFYVTWANSWEGFFWHVVWGRKVSKFPMLPRKMLILLVHMLTSEFLSCIFDEKRTAKLKDNTWVTCWEEFHHQTSSCRGVSQIEFIRFASVLILQILRKNSPLKKALLFEISGPTSLVTRPHEIIPFTESIQKSGKGGKTVSSPRWYNEPRNKHGHDLCSPVGPWV